jgi:hypothetical protein
VLCSNRPHKHLTLSAPFTCGKSVHIRFVPLRPVRHIHLQISTCFILDLPQFLQSVTPSCNTSGPATMVLLLSGVNQGACVETHWTSLDLVHSYVLYHQHHVALVLSRKIEHITSATEPCSWADTGSIKTIPR